MMTLSKLLLLFLTHLIPAFFFMTMITTILLRNRKSTVHLLLAFMMFLFMQLFLAEFVRNLLPIQYSPVIASLWFSSVGILIAIVGIHFFLVLCQLDTFMRKSVYLPILYSPIIAIVMNMFNGATLFSTSTYYEKGMWIYPVYNENYYITLTVSITLILFYLVILTFARRKAPTTEHRQLYNMLLMSAFISFLWHVLFGYFAFPSFPPYPYIYGGIIWCYFLLVAMKKYDFLNGYDRRFSKLFSINPDAILLMQENNTALVNANPAAMQLLDTLDVDPVTFMHSLPQTIKEHLLLQKSANFFAVPYRQYYYFHIYVDFIYLDRMLHYLVIVHNATKEIQQQKQIEYFAFYDPLTNIPNRRYFEERFSEAIGEAEHFHTHSAVALIDLDYLKSLNDVHGHVVGDYAICKVAEVLTTSTASFGFAGRIGGDEFVVFLNVSSMSMSIEQWITQIVKRYQQAMQHIDDVPLSLSVGVSYVGQDGETLEQLLDVADVRMYDMKRQNKEKHSFSSR